MKKILVLGAGLVGKAIASDLCNDYRITAVDMNVPLLRYLEERHVVYRLQD